jgi:hypothetical protein
MNSACKQNAQIIIMHFRLEDVFRELKACTTKKKCLRNANHVNLGKWSSLDGNGNGCALMSFLSNDSENSQVVYYILLFYTAAFNLIQFIVRCNVRFHTGINSMTVSLF